MAIQSGGQLTLIRSSIETQIIHTIHHKIMQRKEQEEANKIISKKNVTNSKGELFS